MSIVDFLQSLNTYTEGLLGITILVIFTGIVYLKNRQEPVREALTGALWTSTIVAVLLRLLGILDDKVLGAYIVLSIAALIMMINRD